MSKRDWKIIAGTATILGILLGVFEVIYAPKYAVNPNHIPSIFHSDFAHWLNLIIVSLPPILYIALDWENLFPKKQKEEDSRESSGERKV